MQNILKYTFLIAITFAFAYLCLEQFIPNLYLLILVCLVISTGGFFVLRKSISSYPFYKLFLIYSFIFFITVPLVGTKEAESLEKRELAPFPEFRMSNVWVFFKGYERYFNDRFAFRNLMLKMNGMIKLYIFNTTSVPDKMEIGKDNWLFSAGKNYVDQTSKPFTSEELDLIETNFEIITKWLADRNIQYYFVCTPVKARIYPDKMPKALLKQCEFSKWNQLYELLNDNDKLRLIDVREELIEGRNIRDTYIKTDTHWNPFGAYLGYQKIMKSMQIENPELKYHNLDDFTLDSLWSQGGDLLMFMGLTEGIPFYNYALNLKSGITPVVIDSSKAPGFSVKNNIREMPGSINDKKIFLVRDSFMEYLKHFINTSFSRSYYTWTTVVPLVQVMHEKPDIVLHEMNEMFLVNTLRLPPEIKGDTAFMNRFYPRYDDLLLKIDANHLAGFENP